MEVQHYLLMIDDSLFKVDLQAMVMKWRFLAIEELFSQSAADSHCAGSDPHDC